MKIPALLLLQLQPLLFLLLQPLHSLRSCEQPELQKGFGEAGAEACCCCPLWMNSKKTLLEEALGGRLRFAQCWLLPSPLQRWCRQQE